MVYTGCMQDNSFANIHFPQRIDLIKKLRYGSFIINDIILLVSFLIFLIWILGIPSLTSLFFHTLSISPFSSVLFMLSGVTLLFGAKRHLISSHEDTEKENHAWWNTYIPLLLAGITALMGFLNFLHIIGFVMPAIFRMPVFSGLSFFLIGVSLIPPFTRILHRFHYTQFLQFIVNGLSVFIVLENVYQLFSSQPLQHIVYVPLPTAFLFSFFSFGILVRWSNRGFFGNLTLDATASVFALRLFLVNLLAAPVIAFLVLLLMKQTPYNIYQTLTVIVTIYTGVSCLLLWVNVKLLYRYELEHLLMRESLRSHNIDLTTEKEVLRKDIARLEQEKQQYAQKLESKAAWESMVDAHE